MDPGDGKFVLQWNDFKANASSTFSKMRVDQDFVDATLVSEDSKLIEAHKVILAASSFFFDSILRQNNHHHPLIYLKGMKGKALVSIVDFIYHGEVTIKPEELDEFMNVGRNLQVEGLEASEEKLEIEQEKTQKETKKKKTKLKTEVTQPKLEPFTNILSGDHDTKTVSTFRENPENNVEELDKEISMMIEKGGKKDFILHTGGRKPYTSKGYTCKICGVEMATRQKISNHVEGRHITGYLHHCNICSDSKSFSSRVSLTAHQSIAHRKQTNGFDLREDNI